MSERGTTTDVDDGLTILDGAGDSQFINIDVELLAQSVCSVKSLIFESGVQSSFALHEILDRSTYAGFHHRSMRITLLQAVKFSPKRSASCDVRKNEGLSRRDLPVLPALNEIRMTLTAGSFLILSSDSCRFSFLIEPSSRS